MGIHIWVHCASTIPLSVCARSACTATTVRPRLMPSARRCPRCASSSSSSPSSSRWASAPAQHRLQASCTESGSTSACTAPAPFLCVCVHGVLARSACTATTVRPRLMPSARRCPRCAGSSSSSPSSSRWASVRALPVCLLLTAPHAILGSEHGRLCVSHWPVVQRLKAWCSCVPYWHSEC